ncbi:MAG TPA: V-type ATP synthase subunit F [Spirochaetota bacterium]|nr:V-type ATP synthase subunit F [Spirochaetota bacterium]HPJ42275.1 V-type ATP synthase subunit F [Spirochaetota bacterium]HPR37016.1 V-type ATP synthase subunit F [Spirochaetota bacterium]
MLIGDPHTVNAFRICGIEGHYADAASSPSILNSLLSEDETLVILITGECAEPLGETIKKVNLETSRRVIIEIPGIDDSGGFSRSLTGYITDALGVAL